MSPELLLKCARKARPDVEWKIGGRTDYVRDAERRFKFRLHYQCDQMTLQEALENEWVFTKFSDSECHFRAIRKSDGYEIGTESKLELLSKCVEASQ